MRLWAILYCFWPKNRFLAYFEPYFDLKNALKCPTNGLKHLPLPPKISKKSIYGSGTGLAPIYALLSEFRSTVHMWHVDKFQWTWIEVKCPILTGIDPLDRSQTQFLRSVRKLTISGWIPRGLGKISSNFGPPSPFGSWFLPRNGRSANIGRQMVVIFDQSCT